MFGVGYNFFGEVIIEGYVLILSCNFFIVIILEVCILLVFYKIMFFLNEYLIV